MCMSILIACIMCTTWAHGTFDPLGLELQTVLSCPVVIGIEPGSSAIVIHVLTLQPTAVVCPAVAVCEALHLAVYVLIRRASWQSCGLVITDLACECAVAQGIFSHGASKTCCWGSHSRWSP